ncbi:MAG: hydroxyacid dehydrogenase [Patescibacteria group bacterium]|nr:hydroxyacid dehydrogenase [Patescibacteria group bacterium]
MHILIFEQQEIHTEAIELLKKEATLQLYYSDQDSYDKEKIQAIFMRSGTQASADFLKDFPNLQYILRVGVGLDNIDTSYCKEQNIQIFNSPGSNANAVAEYVLGQMINLARNIPAAISDTKKGNYDRFQFMGTELSGKTLGIIGCGAIGTFLAKKAHACDMNIIGYDPFVDAQTLQQRNIQKAELEDIYKHSDFITLHLPLIPQTENMIHREVFKQMKNTAYLINAARGGIVHEKELLKVLENREIAGAAVDVYETEPKLPQELISHPSMLPTPHIAAMTEEANKNMAMMPVERFLSAKNNIKEII